MMVMMAYTSPTVYARLSTSPFFVPLSPVNSSSSPLSSPFFVPLSVRWSKKKEAVSTTKLRPRRFSCSLATFRYTILQTGEALEHRSRSGGGWRILENGRGHFGRLGSSVSRSPFGSDRIQTRATAAASVIGPECGRILFMVLAACGAVGQLLEERTKWGGRVSAPLLAMGMGMLLSETGLIPASAPAYDMVFSTLLPLAAALTLLERDVWQGFGEAGSTLKAFLFGAFGTILGTFVAFKSVGRFLGPDGWKIASCLCSTYVGGAINYAATAQVLGLTSGSMLAAGMAADNLAMAAYFGIIMSIPDDNVSKSSNPRKDIDENPGNEKPADPSVESVAVSLAAAAIACIAGDALASVLPSALGGSGLALMAVVASFINAVTGRFCGGTQGGSVPLFAGAQNMGQSLMLLFFTVVGCSAGVKQALAGGWPLFIFIIILLSVHLSTILILGKFAKLPMRSILVASNANIGGAGTAAAMANSRSWPGLVRPALLVGTFGYTIGTAVGVLLGVHALRPMLKISPLVV